MEQVLYKQRNFNISVFEHFVYVGYDAGFISHGEHYEMVYRKKFGMSPWAFLCGGFLRSIPDLSDDELEKRIKRAMDRLIEKRQKRDAEDKSWKEDEARLALRFRD